MDRAIHFLVSFLLFFSALLSRARAAETPPPVFKSFKNHPIILVTPWQNESQNFEKFTSHFSQKPQEIILTDQSQLPEESTGDIVKTLRSHHYKITLVCMGRAASDCLETFFQYPELVAKVNIMISFFGLVRGAHYAEDLMTPPQVVSGGHYFKLPLIQALRMTFDGLMSLVSRAGLSDYAMRPQIREQYLLDHQKKIKQLSQKVDLYSIEVGPKKYGWLPYSKILNL